MGKITIKWFLTTIFVGIAPMLIRLSLYALLINPDSLRIITIPDILLWGLVVNVSIFNAREGLLNYNPRISSASSTISVVLIVIFTLLYFSELINEAHFIFKPSSLLYVGGFFSVATLIICIVYMVNSIPYREKEKNNNEGVH